MDKVVTLFLEMMSGSPSPAWIRLLPLGKVELVDEREPFEVDRESLTRMVEAFQSRGVDLVVDYEHQSLKGDRAPAAGWIRELEAREDGLWGRVEWTAQAEEYLKAREYRYFSPVVRLAGESRRPLALLHVGLTNVPAIRGLMPLVARLGGGEETEEMQAGGADQAEQEVRSRKYGIGIKGSGNVNPPAEFSEVSDEEWGDPVNYRYPCHTPEHARAALDSWNQVENQAEYTPQERSLVAGRLLYLGMRQGLKMSEEDEEQAAMRERLLQRLNLGADADEWGIYTRVEELLGELAGALNLPGEAQAACLLREVAALKAGPEEMRIIQEEMAALKARLSEEVVSRVVEEALSAGKISPAQHAWAVEYCRRDLESFQSYVAQAPKVVPVGERLPPYREGEGEPRGLTAQERAICRSMNLPPETYAAAKAEMERAK